MAPMPTVKPGDWITFGNGIEAVVCNIYDNKDLGDIEVVYLDDRDRAINVAMIWRDNLWDFRYEGLGGGYADNYPRFKRYVDKLRREI